MNPMARHTSNYKSDFRTKAAPLKSHNKAIDMQVETKKTEADLLHDLIQVTFTDTLRHTGIPRNWLTCEIREQPSSASELKAQVCLVMHSRNGHLLRHSLAFQDTLRDRLKRYQPNVDFDGVEWVWKYAEKCARGSETLPTARDWSMIREKAKKLMASVHVSASEPLRLPRGRSELQVADTRLLTDMFSHLKSIQ